jgi:signal transduction histidine kinase
LADPQWFRQVILYLIDAAISHMEEGSIDISAQSMPENNLVYIWLDVPLTASDWNDPVDLMQSTPIVAKQKTVLTLPDRTPGLALLLSQTLLEVMQGRLEILPALQSTLESPATRIQVAIPQLTPETESLE